MSSVTNRLARRVALAFSLTLVATFFLSGFGWFNPDPAFVYAIAPLIPALIGVVNWRNVEEQKTDPAGYRSEHYADIQGP